MDFFFTKDYRGKHRFFTTEPGPAIGEKISWPKEMWRRARKKLLLLPPRILRQEQAFIRFLKPTHDRLLVHHSGHQPEKKLKWTFFFYLQKQKTKHIFLLIGEFLLLPLSGLIGLLPGPNVIFGILALLLITHWQALRGINRMSRQKLEFIPARALSEWEEAVARGQEERYAELLEKLEKEFRLSGLMKVLWK